MLFSDFFLILQSKIGMFVFEANMSSPVSH